MGAGPIIAAAGLALFLRLHARVDYLADVLPAVLVFALGLSMTVAPLTAAVLAGVETGQAGIASAVNNAVARVAGLLGVAVVGAVAGGTLSVAGFHRAIGLAAGLVFLGGVCGVLFIRNPRRVVRAEDCPGGSLVGASRDAGDWAEAKVPARAA